jgi:hypothetical protein
VALFAPGPELQPEHAFFRDLDLGAVLGAAVGNKRPIRRPEQIGLAQEIPDAMGGAHLLVGGKEKLHRIAGNDPESAKDGRREQR